MQSISARPLADLVLPTALDGRPVFPIKARTKDRPLTRWRHGGTYAKATADPAVIMWWAKRWPDANIGMPTGDDLAVIDVDPRAGGVAPDGLPETLMATTPSGGEHYYFMTTELVPNSAGLLAPGVDVRGEGGMLVIPPSVRPEGPYRWVDPTTPIAAAPRWLITACQERTFRVAGGGDTVTRRFVCREEVAAGGRNSYLAAYAGWLLAHGHDEDDVGQWLQDENQLVCRPPLPRDEVERVAASIGAYHR